VKVGNTAKDERDRMMMGESNITHPMKINGVRRTKRVYGKRVQRANERWFAQGESGEIESTTHHSSIHTATKTKEKPASNVNGGKVYRINKGMRK
jgi:hypothetical protein